MSRHIQTYSRRVATEQGGVDVSTSAWRATGQPVWLRIATTLNNFTTDEARAIARALNEAADHTDAARQLNQAQAA